MFVGINHVTIIVNDKKRASDFYFNILGFEKVDIGKSLWAKVGKQYIHINENSKHVVQKSFQHFSVEVDNLLPFLEQLINNDVDVFDLDDNNNKKDININLNKQMRNYFVNDPFGNLIEFIDSTNKFFNP
ncbi:VOC family protein [Candidatus Woesebacteria bacterium]|nr:VOC family protein [Candidatus Woesebacteria bacterium]